MSSLDVYLPLVSYYCQKGLECERHFLKVVSQGDFSIYMNGKQTYVKNQETAIDI